MAKSALNIGQELHSDSVVYRIESVLGQGSFGITYKAKAFTIMKGKFGEELVETNTPKAIKEFFMKEINEREESGSITGMSEGSLSYNYAQKFKKEAENLASMNHPNIVKVIDFISANNTYYYVMDFIDGESLNDYLKHHKMSEKEATDTIKEVAKALKYMHEEKHMLHLDLKPGNIMRRESDGHIFLIDFGLSKHYSENGLPETSTSVGLGTPGYAPIEQANSKNAKQFRATLDVYALGATFYKLLTGLTPPYADEMLPHGDIVRNDLFKLGISDNLILVVVNAMHPLADERTQNVSEFLESLNGNCTNAGNTVSANVGEGRKQPNVIERKKSNPQKIDAKNHNITKNIKERDSSKYLTNDEKTILSEEATQIVSVSKKTVNKSVKPHPQNSPNLHKEKNAVSNNRIDNGKSSLVSFRISLVVFFLIVFGGIGIQMLSEKAFESIGVVGIYSESGEIIRSYADVYGILLDICFGGFGFFMLSFIIYKVFYVKKMSIMLIKTLRVLFTITLVINSFLIPIWPDNLTIAFVDFSFVLMMLSFISLCIRYHE